MWYYAIDGEKHGPVDEEEIQRLVDDGDLGIDDLVWTNGMEDWTPVSEVEDLQPSPPPLPDEEESTSPPPISEDRQDRITGKPDPDVGDDGSFSSSGYAEDAAVGNRTLSDASKFTETESTSGATFPGFGNRLLAYLIDMVILFVTGVVLGAFAIGFAGAAPNEGVLNVAGAFLTWMYFALYESSDDQATPGKHMMGMKVTDLQGGKIGFGKATGRHFGKILSGAIFLIGFIMAAFTEKKQALHDKMAGCLVVKDS